MKITVKELREMISEAVKDGKLAVVGANYKLELGEVHAILTHGQI